MAEKIQVLEDQRVPFENGLSANTEELRAKHLETKKALNIVNSKIKTSSDKTEELALKFRSSQERSAAKTDKRLSILEQRINLLTTPADNPSLNEQLMTLQNEYTNILRITKEAQQNREEDIRNNLSSLEAFTARCSNQSKEFANQAVANYASQASHTMDELQAKYLALTRLFRDHNKEIESVRKDSHELHRNFRAIENAGLGRTTDQTSTIESALVPYQQKISLLDSGYQNLTATMENLSLKTSTVERTLEESERRTSNMLDNMLTKIDSNFEKSTKLLEITSASQERENSLLAITQSADTARNELQRSLENLSDTNLGLRKRLEVLEISTERNTLAAEELPALLDSVKSQAKSTIQSNTDGIRKELQELVFQIKQEFDYKTEKILMIEQEIKSSKERQLEIEQQVSPSKDAEPNGEHYSPIQNENKMLSITDHQSSSDQNLVTPGQVVISPNLPVKSENTTKIRTNILASRLGLVKNLPKTSTFKNKKFSIMDHAVTPFSKDVYTQKAFLYYYSYMIENAFYTIFSQNNNFGINRRRLEADIKTAHTLLKKEPTKRKIEPSSYTKAAITIALLAGLNSTFYYLTSHAAQAEFSKILYLEAINSRIEATPMKLILTYAKNMRDTLLLNQAKIACLTLNRSTMPNKKLWNSAGNIDFTINQDFKDTQLVVREMLGGDGPNDEKSFHTAIDNCDNIFGRKQDFTSLFHTLSTLNLTEQRALPTSNFGETSFPKFKPPAPDRQDQDMSPDFYLEQVTSATGNVEMTDQQPDENQKTNFDSDTWDTHTTEEIQRGKTNPQIMCDESEF